MTSTRWFAPAPDSAADDGQLVYVIPHAGAGAAAVTGLAHEMLPDVIVHGVRLPARESRFADPMPATLTELAGELAAALAEHAGSRPFVLLGHCSGARVAFEAARVLQDTAQLRGVGISASPHTQPASLGPGPAELSFERFLAFVAEDAGQPQLLDIPPELQRIIEPALRADYKMAWEHQDDDRPVQVPLLLLAGRQDQIVPAELVRGWRDRTHASAVEIELDGGHDSLVAAPASFAQALRTGLAQLGPRCQKTAR